MVHHSFEAPATVASDASRIARHFEGAVLYFEGAVLQESHPGDLRPPTFPGPRAGAANRVLLD